MRGFGVCCKGFVFSVVLEVALDWIGFKDSEFPERSGMSDWAWLLESCGLPYWFGEVARVHRC